MKIYCMSDIHGCIASFEAALEIIYDKLLEPNTKLILLGDYIHGGENNYGVLDKIISLQNKLGHDKVIALMGNHENFVLKGSSTINDLIPNSYSDYDGDDYKYTSFISHLPLYYVEGNTIFVHAGIDEEVGEYWEWGTSDDVFTDSYPAKLGKIEGVDSKVVAGHVHTSEIADDTTFHSIYFDGQSHYYIDGDTISSGEIPILMVDTDEDKYYRVTEGGQYIILPYGEKEK